MKEEEFEKKFVRAIIQIRHQMDADKQIYGDSFIEFTDRKIEVIQPDKVMLKLEMYSKDKIDKAKVKQILLEQEKKLCGCDHPLQKGGKHILDCNFYEFIKELRLV